jgi:hypothetical protein
MNIRFEPVNKENYRQCIEMTKLENVASNMFSIVQAYVYESIGFKRNGEMDDEVVLVYTFEK